MVLTRRSLTLTLGVTSVALATIASASTLLGCVTLEDRCVDVRCGAGQICVDREPAPVCVCDDAHELDETGACVAVEIDGTDGDAGPEE